MNPPKECKFEEVYDEVLGEYILVFSDKYKIKELKSMLNQEPVLPKIKKCICSECMKLPEWEDRIKCNHLE